MKRLGFRKSRLGCIRCKQRRVKCDEAVPCTACRRHGLPCSLEITDQPPRDRLSPADAGNLRCSCNAISALDTGMGDSNRSKGSVAAAPCSPPYQSFSQTDRSPSIGDIPYLFKYSTEASSIDDDDWISDAELMHHYSTSAYQFFSFPAKVHKALQIDVPREAFSNPYLLHQMLAFSAFHLAYIRPDKRQVYQLVASKHQAKAISGVREALECSVTRENCHSLYASSVFLIVSAFSTLISLEVYNRSFLPLECLSDIFTLITGMSVLLNISQEDLHHGPLKGLFTSHDGPILSPSYLQGIVTRLGELKELVLSSASAGLDESQPIAIEAASSLEDSIAEVLRKNSCLDTAQLKVVFLWPSRLGNSFVGLVKGRHRLSLVVVAYYCVILSYTESNCWFLHGWAEAVMECISRELANTPYQNMVSWPTEAISRSNK